MIDWKQTVFSDGTPLFVSTREPQIGERVAIRMRIHKEAPVHTVFLRCIIDGSQDLTEMRLIREEHSLLYYEAEVTMSQRKLRYQFYLVGENILYVYTQRGLTVHLQDETADFVLLSDYHQPAWVKSAVFYQIFPERFCNGDTTNDVQDNEIVKEGFPSMQIRDWNQPPTEWNESHCMDFYGGDLAGIEQKIPYLKEMGVTALYLNPIFTAPSVHKYDCIDYEHVDPHFGGDEALASLSRALHENGMKLILDISINHTGSDHKWFNKDCRYFAQNVGAYHNPESEERHYYFFEEDNSYMGWRGVMDLPEMDYHCEKLREKLYRAEDSIIRKWLKPPYNIDGWRFDVADVMAKYGPDQLDHEVWKEIRTSIRETNPEAYILAEDWTDCNEYLQGEEWDSPMNYYGCARALRPFLGLNDPYLSFYEKLRKVRYRFTAQDVKNRIVSYLSQMPYALQQNQFNLIDSHDVNRLHNNPVNRSEYRGAVIFQFMLPGTPCIYYGTEAQIDGWVGSVEGCRYTMPWGTDFENGEIYKLHRDLAGLRRAHKALTEGSFQFLYAEGGIIAFVRFDEKESWIMVMSTEEEDRWIRIPVGVIGAAADAFLTQADALGKECLIKAEEDGILELLVRGHETYLLSNCR